MTNTTNVKKSADELIAHLQPPTISIAVGHRISRHGNQFEIPCK